MRRRHFTATDDLRLLVAVTISGQPITPVPSATYRTPGVPTTWRELLLASMSVGRAVSWLAARFPGVALPELRVRADSLRIGLARSTEAGNPIAVPSQWLQRGADQTERVAVGYRLGMAAAHWAAMEVIGLPTTRHVSSLPSTDFRRGTSLRAIDKEADLFSRIRGAPLEEWLLEAKGGYRAPTKRTRIRGAAQLDAAGARAAALKRHGTPVWSVPYGQVLVSAEASPRLGVLVEIGLPPSPAASKLMPSNPFDPCDSTSWPLLRPAASLGSDWLAEQVLSRREVFESRALIAAALLDSNVDQTQLQTERGPQPARLLALPGVDARVGLLESAFQQAQVGLNLARNPETTVDKPPFMSGMTEDQLDAWLEPGRNLGRPEELQALLREFDVPSDEQVLLLDPVEPSSGPGAAVDRLGRVVVLGPSWTSESDSSGRRG